MENRALTRVKFSGSTSQTVEENIPVPEDTTPGEYHLVVWCFDVSGNETVVARDLVLAKEE